MILEHCDIQIEPAKSLEFEKAILHGVETVISKARGFRGFKVNHSLETPSRYLLLIYWDTLENHTVDFRGSAAFADWRAIVGPFFISPPVVEHMTLVGKSQ
jgi:heme-degrading monooxygenase HmoA